MDLRGARAVVVGGAGLIGSHVVDRLTREDVAEIVVYDNFTRGTMGNLEAALADPRVRIFELGGDILHTDILQKAFEKTDVVFHLAALWLLHCHEYPQSAFEVNIRGTFNVLEACRLRGVRKLVYSSSASVYGDAVEVPMTEDHPYNNRTFYGATKIAGEHMARAHHHRYGLDYVGLRYMNIYGPRQDYMGAYVAVVMKILDRIDRGEPPIVYGDGSQSYDFIYVEDAADCNVLAARSDATASLCASRHAMSRRSPSSTGVFARKPRSRAAASVEPTRRVTNVWPAGSYRIPRCSLPVRRSSISQISLIVVSTPAPTL